MRIITSSVDETRGSPGRQVRDIDYLESRIPDLLRDVADRHHKHLGALVESLYSAGISEALIKQSVDVLIESYRDELAAVAFELAKVSERV